MVGEWQYLPFNQAVLVNPQVRLERGQSYPFVDMGSINPGSRCVYAAEERVFTGGGARFRSGDTLMARITPCLENGKVARYFDQERTGVAFGSTEFIVIRGRPKLTDTDFAYYLTKWNEVQDYAIGQMTGTSGRQRVPVESLNHLIVPVPALPEQQAIAHILGTLDDKIELNRKMNETLEAMARAIFKAWFVDFEPVRAKMEGRWQRGQSLPGFPAHLYDLFPDRLVDSELGEIPEGWRVGPFRDVVKILRDQEDPLSLPNTVFSHYSIPAYDNGQSPKKELGESIKSLKFRVPPGVVLLSKLNPGINRVWLVDIQPDDLPVCSTEFLVLRSLSPAGSAFVYCLARSPVFRQTLEGLVTGTSKSHQRAQSDPILNISITQPGTRILEEFEMMVGAILERVLECRREIRILAGIRDMLLPKLISGELRIKDAESFNRERCL